MLLAQNSFPASQPVMLLFALGMLATYLGIAHGRIHKTVVALLGGGLLTLLGVSLSVFEYNDIYEFLKNDLNVFGVSIGTGILVDITGKSGLFHFISMWIVRTTKGAAGALFLAICLLTFVFVAILTIVPAVLILTSLVLVICRALDYNPKPYLLSVAICANCGAAVSFSSGLPNIMIGTAAGIPYLHFLIVSAPYALFSLLLAVVLLRWTFRHSLAWRQTPDEAAALEAKIAEFDPWALVENRWLLFRSAAVLLATVLGFAMARLLGLGMDFIAMAGGTAALLLAGKSVEDTISKVNWTVILFFVGLFLVVGCVEESGALRWAAQGVVDNSQDNPTALVILLTGFSAIASAFVDNIPVSATLIPIVRQITALQVPPELVWWSIVLGCNLGGSGTPIGSSSCVIALHTLKKEANQNVGWGEFMKLGGGIMLLQVAGAIVYLLVLERLGWLPAL